MKPGSQEWFDKIWEQGGENARKRGAAMLAKDPASCKRLAAEEMYAVLKAIQKDGCLPKSWMTDRIDAAINKADGKP